MDISGTDWCLHANTNLELDLSPQLDLMEVILGMSIYILGVGLYTTCQQCIFPYHLGPSIVKLSPDHVFNYHICLSCLIYQS